MEGFLDRAKIDYVLFHLKQHIEISDSLIEKFVFTEQPINKTVHEGKVIFALTNKKIDLDIIVYNNEIPILFPITDKTDLYYIDERNNLCFNHDLLKSAFYLLSGYQETLDYKGDKYERFPYSESIQCKLGFISKPVVNYYFKWITDGLEKFTEIHTEILNKKDLQSEFILTHDIDSIDKYTLYNIVFSLKQLLGLTKHEGSFYQRLYHFIDAFKNYFKVFNRPNPYWNFDFLIETAPNTISRQIFFFLNKDQLHKDSYYTFKKKRIKKLFEYLKYNKCEIGIHGTTASSSSELKMKEIITNLEKHSNVKVISNRQHCLKYKLTETTKIHENCGLKEDFTLGFAAHEGFRNSYCHKFKLFDFTQNKMFGVWQFPLNVMDDTLFGYRKLSFDKANKTIDDILVEIEKFNGIFTLLWHNSYFDEVALPGISSLYLKILSKASNKKTSYE